MLDATQLPNLVQQAPTHGFGVAPQPEFIMEAPDKRGKRKVTGRFGDVRLVDEIRVDREEDRRRFLQKLAIKADLPKTALENFDDALVQAAQESDSRRIVPLPPAEPANLDAARDFPEEVQRAAEDLLQSGDLRTQLCSAFEALGIVGEILLALAIFFVATSRLLSRPLSGCVQSASGSGKSYVTTQVLRLFPEDEVVQATSITDQALYYLPPGSLKHKVLFRAERKHADPRDPAGAANAGLQFRELISEGVLSKMVTCRGDDGTPKTMQITQEGPVAFLETTTAEEIYPEDATRVLSLVTDESPEQTLRIQTQQQNEARGLNPDDEERREFIRQTHQAAQKMLVQYKVRVPFAHHLRLPVNRVAARRALPQFLSLIEAVALFRQRHKTPSNDWIDADVIDYALALEIYMPILHRQFAPLNERARSLLQTIRDHINPLVPLFTRKDAQEWSGICLTETRNRLELLVAAGLIVQVEGGRGVAFKYRLNCATVENVGGIAGLPSPAELRQLLDEESAASRQLPNNQS